MPLSEMQRGALFGGGEEGADQYRYLLHRRWNDLPLQIARKVSFIMLNPSTADHLQDDPTIRRCISFAQRDGFDELTILNLFAHRSPDPKVMKAAKDPVGEDNDMYISMTCDLADLVVVAWGTHGTYLGRDKEVLKILESASVQPKCLGITKDGHPKHPLYIAGDTEFIDFPM